MLRSVTSDPIKVRFLNASGLTAEILWVTTDGNYMLYGTLKPKEYIDVNTFSQHYWVFRDKATGRTLIANNHQYFVGVKNNYYYKDLRSSHNRFIVMITRYCMVPSLRLQSIDFLCRNLGSCTNVKYLEIPKTLKQEIIGKIHRANPSFHSCVEWVFVFCLFFSLNLSPCQYSPNWKSFIFSFQRCENMREKFNGTVVTSVLTSPIFTSVISLYVWLCGYVCFMCMYS